MLRGFQLTLSGTVIAAVLLAAAPAALAQDPAAQPAAPKPPVLTLDGDVALITILIKADKTADFELVLNKLKEALAKSEKPERKQQAAGWHVFKSNQMAPAPDGTKSVVYIMRIDPVIKGQEYDITQLIAEVFPVEVQELFQKYKDAFGGRAINPLTKVMSMQ
jgi:hypothetical protein